MPFRTQAEIKTADGVPANYSVNTFHFLAPNIDELVLAHIALAAFYNTVSSQMGNLVLQSGSPLTITSYDLADPMPRAPELETFHTLSPDNTGSLPPEVTLVLSFQAAQISGTRQARRRNRVYLPFPKSSTNGADGRPTAGIISSWTSAATTMLAASGNGTTAWAWAIYSPTDNFTDLVDNGWTDNEWDTQRRRGREATSRSLF